MHQVIFIVNNPSNYMYIYCIISCFIFLHLSFQQHTKGFVNYNFGIIKYL